jgi:DNA-binding transcriptional regulator of glucitol operon
VSVLLKPRWLALHVFSVFVVVSCAGLGWWQLIRADHGNGRSFGYAMQWPAIGIFGLGVWLWLCRDGLRNARREPDQDEADAEPAEPVAVRRSAVTVADPEAEPELAAYNAMLARLHEGDKG